MITTMKRQKRVLFSVLCILVLVIRAHAQTVKVDSFYATSVKSFRPVTFLIPDTYVSWRSIPVLYLLHGRGGDHTDWTQRSELKRYARDLNLLIVMPSVGNSWYINSLTNPSERYEVFMAQDLPAFVKSKFPNIDTTKQAIAGLSMGGYGAVTLALKYPSRYKFAASMSGALRPDTARYGKTEDLFALFARADSTIFPYFYIAIGIQDQIKRLNESNREFVKLLGEKNLQYEFHERPGTHHWSVWDREIRSILPRLVEVLDIR